MIFDTLRTTVFGDIFVTSFNTSWVFQTLFSIGGGIESKGTFMTPVLIKSIPNTVFKNGLSNVTLFVVNEELGSTFNTLKGRVCDRWLCVVSDAVVGFKESQTVCFKEHG